MSSSSNLFKDTVACLSDLQDLVCGDILVDEYTSFMNGEYGTRTHIDDAIALQSFATFLLNPTARAWASTSDTQGGILNYVQFRNTVATYFQDVAYADPVSADVYIAQLLQTEPNEDVASILVSTTILTVVGDPVTLTLQNIQSVLNSFVMNPTASGFSVGFIQQVQRTLAELAPYFPNVPFSMLAPPPSLYPSAAPSSAPSATAPKAPPAPATTTPSWIPTALAIVFGIGGALIVGSAFADIGDSDHEAY